MALFAASLLLRVLFVTVVCAWSGVTLAELLRATSDAPSYMAVAEGLRDGVFRGTGWDSRVFLGYPVAIALLLPFFELSVATFWVGATCAAACAPLAAALTRNTNLGVVMIALPPAWFFQPAIGMNEGVFLAPCLGAFLLVRRRRWAGAGVAIGIAALVRPVAVFAFLGLAAYAVRAGTRRQVVAFVVLAGVVTGLAIPLNLWLYGDPVVQFRKYGMLQNVPQEALREIGATGAEGVSGPPFYWLGKSAVARSTPDWKRAYIGLHLLAVLAACALLIHDRRPCFLPIVFRWWAIGMTVFIVSTGPYWAFHSFDRYATWALPAYVWAFRRPLRACRVVLPLLLATSVAISCYEKVSDLGALHRYVPSVPETLSTAMRYGPLAPTAKGEESAAW